MTRPPDHPATVAPRIGVLLVNLGTPDAPDAPSVRRYLRISFRPPRREIPQSVGTDPARNHPERAKKWPRLCAGVDRGRSPRAASTRAADALRQLSVNGAGRLCGCGTAAEIVAAIDALKAADANAFSSRALSQFRRDAATWLFRGEHLKPLYRQPPLRFPPITTTTPSRCANSDRDHPWALDFTPACWQAYGMPSARCARHPILAMQKRRACWRMRSAAPSGGLPVALLPSANGSNPRPIRPFEQLGRDGLSVAIFAPGFSADCLETLEELTIRGQQQFESAGGKRFAYLPCLNADAPGMAMLEALARRELAGWL